MGVFSSNSFLLMQAVKETAEQCILFLTFGFDRKTFEFGNESFHSHQIFVVSV